MNGPQGLAFDASGDLFVANLYNDTVTEYAPPYTGPPSATISIGLSGPEGLAFDTSGDLFVANRGNVTEYAPPYTGAPIATISNGVGEPDGLALSP
jgi:sugar lactone lactonase YvrE